MTVVHDTEIERRFSSQFPDVDNQVKEYILSKSLIFLKHTYLNCAQLFNVEDTIRENLSEYHSVEDIWDAIGELLISASNDQASSIDEVSKFCAELAELIITPKQNFFR